MKNNVNRLKVDKIPKYFKFGGYHGFNTTCRCKCGPRLTALGLYVYALERPFKGLAISKTENYEDKIYLQSRIDFMQEILNNYVYLCVNKKTNTFEYSEENFDKFTKIFGKEIGRELSNVSNLIPYYAQVFLLTQGYKFKDEEYLIKNNILGSVSLDIEKTAPYTISSLTKMADDFLKINKVPTKIK